MYQGKVVVSNDGNLFLACYLDLKNEIIISGPLETDISFQTRITLRFRF